MLRESKFNKKEFEELNNQIQNLSLLVHELENIPKIERFEKIINKWDDIDRLVQAAEEIEKISNEAEKAAKKVAELRTAFNKLNHEISDNIDPLTINLIVSADRITKNID